MDSTGQALMLNGGTISGIGSLVAYSGMAASSPVISLVGAAAMAVGAASTSFGLASIFSKKAQPSEMSENAVERLPSKPGLFTSMMPLVNMVYTGVFGGLGASTIFNQATGATAHNPSAMVVGIGGTLMAAAIGTGLFKDFFSGNEQPKAQPETKTPQPVI